MRSTAGNIWLRRHLLWVLVSSNIKRQGKNTVLGYFWWLLDPVLMTAVYYILVSIIFNRGGDNQPFILFVMCGLLAWKAFSDSVSQSIRILSAQAGIIRAISFPKAVLPLSLVLSNAVFFGFGLLVAVGLACFYGSEYGSWPSLYYLMIPVIIAIQCLFTAGVALVMSVAGVLFKDTGNIMSHVLRMWYFLSPGLYSLDRLPDKLQTVFQLNPFAGLMTAFRDVLMYGRMPAIFDLAYPFGIGLVSLALGFILFRRLEGRVVQNL